MKHILLAFIAATCLASCNLHAADTPLDTIAAAASAPAVTVINPVTPVDPFVKFMAYVAAVVFIARIVVKLTPTPKDDTALDYIVTGLKHIGLTISDKPFIWTAALCMLSLSSCAMDPAVKQRLIANGTSILITGGEALLVSGGDGGAAFTAMSSEAVADIPGLRQAIKNAAARAPKNPTAPVVISATPAAITPTTP